MKRQRVSTDHRTSGARAVQGSRWLIGGLLAALVAASPPVRADEWGLGTFRDPFATPTAEATWPRLSLDGYLRLRGDALINFDLDRGPTPSTGQTLYALPLTDPQDQDTLRSGNLRFRLEPKLDLGWEVSVKALIDGLDNVVLGSTPSISTHWAAMNAAATSQQAPSDSIRLRQVWGEALTPFGMLLAGRMGVHWGLGVVANDGRCLDCDHGDSVDGLSLVLPLLGHAIGLSYSIAATGPNLAGWGSGAGQPVDLDPRDDVRSLSLGVLRFNAPAVRNVLLAGERHVVDYGLSWSFRWQELDFPGWSAEQSQTSALDELPSANQAITRNFAGHLLDGWLAWETPRHKLELELVLMWAGMDDASLVPGLHTEPITALQYGGVARETFRPAPWLELSLELGLASGDPAPGFGARPGRDRDRARPGDLDGPQLELPHDPEVTNLRFSPDYHVDLILWREIVGTVTDALYLRPRVQVGPWEGFTGELVVIYSEALEAASPPGGEAPLGFETDLALRYRSRDGLVAGLQYGWLVPLAGLDNPALGLTATSAHRVHALLAFVF